MEVLGLKATLIASQVPHWVGLQGEVVYENPDRTLIFSTAKGPLRITRGVFLSGQRIYSTSNRIIPKLKSFTRAYYSTI